MSTRWLAPLMLAALAAGEIVTAPQISDQASPAVEFTATARDGHRTFGELRKPPGSGPFPAIIFLHGGLKEFTRDHLRLAIRGVTRSRFLAAGYVIVNPTFRDRDVDPQTTDALEDCKAVVEYVRKLPEVDPASVVVWGSSGGGSLALELAGESPLAAIIAEEPASILFAGLMNTRMAKRGEKYTLADTGEITTNPQKYWTPELQAFTRAKIRKIHCPIFLPEGGASLINRINNEIIVPEILKAGKTIEVALYPGQPHGFAMENRVPGPALKCFQDAGAFCLRYLKTKPRPMQADLVKYVPSPSAQ